MTGRSPLAPNAHPPPRARCGPGLLLTRSALRRPERLCQAPALTAGNGEAEATPHAAPTTGPARPPPLSL